jgi:DNA-3-methyladenine glycosylase
MRQTAALSARRSALGPALSAAFYDRPTEIVARELLGTVLEHRSRDGTAAGRIVEVEAYLGPHDPACHSASGLTSRNRHLHGPPGTAYVYLIYGLHWCVNAVTREAGFGSAVLIRAIEPLVGVMHMRRRRGGVPDRALTSGPGRVCQALAIDRSQDGVSLTRGALRILAGDPVTDTQVIVTARIGITRAADWPLRFAVRDNVWVSRGRPAAEAATHRRTRPGVDG